MIRRRYTLTLVNYVRNCSGSSVWSLFYSKSSESLNKPPEWFESLCRSLYFKTSECIEKLNSKSEEEVQKDPLKAFTYIPFNLLDEKEYNIMSYSEENSFSKYFGAENWSKLCLGDRNKKYICFATTYMFPDRRQIPTVIGSIPAKLWVCPSNPEPCVYLQLSDLFPPAAWLPMDPSATDIINVLSEFAERAAIHAAEHHAHWAHQWESAHSHLMRQRLPATDAHVLRYMGKQARDALFWNAPYREYPKLPGVLPGRV